MSPSKWNLVSMVMLSLVSTGTAYSSTNHTRQQKRHVPAASVHQSANVPPYWEYILREFVFKTISPPPPGNNDLYKRLLDAPLYGGPFPIVSSDAASVVLSRGDVYYLPNGHWLLCQEGCNDCEPCIEHTHPTVKWILRRIKRLPSHGPARHDLQLTIVPQIDGSYHMSNLWPRSYVYVSTQADEIAYYKDKHGYSAAGNVYTNPENSFSVKQRKSNNSWRFLERDSGEQRVPEEQSNATTARQLFEGDSGRSVGATVPFVKDTTEKTTEKSTKEQQPRVKPADKLIANDTVTTAAPIDNTRNRLRQLIPKLILGTDQLGQKHLVHVVPADGSNNVNSTSLVSSNPSNYAGMGQYHNRTAYQRMMRRVFDSLSSNKRSIESFLEPLMRTGNVNQQFEEHEQQETRNALAGLGQLNRSHQVYNDRIRNGTSTQMRLPHNDRFISNAISLNRNADDSNDLYFKTQNGFDTTFDQNSHGNGNVSGTFNSESANSDFYSENAFNSSMKHGGGLRTGREHKLGPRKFKIVVTTESTTKSMNKSDAFSNHSRSTLEGNS
ncbi:uncharacterized protein LOC128874009 [Hylaeus volcanicus]|uniref:uncharacterized protein LOC128874009 n=1 Tax=Hylaeus volcanicus TaxID=313075 RepID=UPI0023B7B74A|nr:uncharacterized protein LOC128874009 [Hylaeus volcanicus]